jgi:hypothetical protein
MAKQEHPLERVGAIFFGTPPVIEFKRALRRLIDGGELSMLCYSQSRSGKSSLVNNLVEFGAERKTAVVFNVVLSGTHDKSVSWPRLARELADSRGGRSPFSHFSEAEALFKRAQTDAHLLDVTRILFLLDDAQELSADQYVGLRKLMQDLVNAGFSPFVLQFAQPEILLLPNRLFGSNQGSLVDRFFLRKHRLRGLRLNEYSAVLSSFDETIWPAPAGPTYTAYFLPDLWEKGWRLKDQSKHFERAFHALAKKFSREPDDIPIKFLVSAATSLLMGSSETRRQASDLELLIDAHVQSSGIIESYELGDLEKKVLTILENQSRTRRKGQ